MSTKMSNESRNEEKSITFSVRVKQEELKNIKENAEKYNMSKNAYIVQSALNDNSKLYENCVTKRVASALCDIRSEINKNKLSDTVKIDIVEKWMEQIWHIFSL
ncbi:MAG: plasmid mobilization protein [Anaerocolumna sp.]